MYSYDKQLRCMIDGMLQEWKMQNKMLAIKHEEEASADTLSYIPVTKGMQILHTKKGDQIMEYDMGGWGHTESMGGANSCKIFIRKMEVASLERKVTVV
jgi:hypothetical protein